MPYVLYILSLFVVRGIRQYELDRAAEADRRMRARAEEDRQKRQARHRARKASLSVAVEDAKNASDDPRWRGAVDAILQALDHAD